MQKRGQFYLAAAIIIISIVLGLVAVRSYVSSPESEDLTKSSKSELNLESGKVIDFALINKDETHGMMENWTRIYIDAMRGKSIDTWVFVYGNSSNVSVMSFVTRDSGTVRLVTGGTGAGVTLTEGVYERTNYATPGNNAKVTVGNFTYEFTLAPGKDFMFLIRKGGYVSRQD